VREDLRVRVARALAGRSARDLFRDLDGQPVQLPVDQQFYPSREQPSLAPRSGVPGADVMATEIWQLSKAQRCGSSLWRSILTDIP
jgi:hypothetical protein